MIKVHCSNPATVKALKKRITEYSNQDQVELLQILAQFNIDPIYIPRSQKESRALLSQHLRMPDTDLQTELYEVLRQMAARTKTDKVRKLQDYLMKTGHSTTCIEW